MMAPRKPTGAWCFFADMVAFPVRFTTHAHEGFRLARCRNEGVAVSTAPYLLFTDADCLLPADHVACHLQFRRVRRVVAGDCYRLDQETSETPHGGCGCSRSVPEVGRVARRLRMRVRRSAAGATTSSVVRCGRASRATILAYGGAISTASTVSTRAKGGALRTATSQVRLGRLGSRSRSILGKTAGYHLWTRPMRLLRGTTWALPTWGTSSAKTCQRAVAKGSKNVLARGGGSSSSPPGSRPSTSRTLARSLTRMEPPTAPN